MTDNEIIKALVCCTPTYEKVCGKCIYREYKSHGISEKQCSEYMREDLFNLIFRQKAEIERLTHKIDELQHKIESCNSKSVELHGKWLPEYDTYVDEWERESEPMQAGWLCSLCGVFEYEKSPYCKCCGAKMDKEGDNDEIKR